MRLSHKICIVAIISVICLASMLLTSCSSDDAVPFEPTESDTEKETNAKSTTKKEKTSKKYPSNILDPSVNTLPDYTGDPFDHVAVDLGEGSYMNIAKKTSIEEYNSYKAVLEESGYTLYTSNVIGNNQYATYYNDTEIVNAIFLAYNHNIYNDNPDEFKGVYEMRVTVDKREKFDLPILKDENVYESTLSPMLTLVSDSGIIWPGRMGYIYQLSDGSFFIIDGGYTDGNQGESGGLNASGISTGCHSSAPYIMNVLKEYAPDPENIRIAAWLITHMHSDHFGGFIDLALNADFAEDKSRITIEQLVYSMSSEENAKNADSSQRAWSRVFARAISQEGWGDRLERKTKAHPGQQFFVRELTCTVYTSEDLLHCNNYDPFLDGKYINNTSIVTMVNFMGKDILHLADSSSANNPGVLAPIYNTSLKADILQVAHHGYGDTAADSIYKYVKPEIVFWPVTAQHFYGYEIGYIENGHEYGGVKNVGLNDILFEDGIRHYIHGSTMLTFKDFKAWIPEPTDDPLQIYDKNTWEPDVNYIKNNNYK
ncbi:MAG: MBL fold metallo-hydrolase [Clostridia bacterium]|nr:MBL fold metallo-hydrolase [Clostridia bacterium]